MAFPDTLDSFTRHVDEGDTISNEAQVIPGASPYTVTPTHLLLQQVPSNISIPGFSEVSSGAPSAGQFDVDYLNSTISFNSANANAVISITYITAGDKYMAEDVNELQVALELIERNIGIDAQGAYNTIRQRLDAIESITLINFIENEVPVGAINGINVTYTLTNTPTAGSESVYRNGLRQRRGAAHDYQRVGNSIIFNATSVPQTGDNLLVNYRYL